MYDVCMMQEREMVVSMFAWCMYTWCMYTWCVYTWCMYDAYSYDLPWPWCMWVWCTCPECGWMHVYMYDADFFCNRPTDKSTMNDACMYLQVCELCMYDACIYHLRPLTLVHVCFMCICMMHAQYIYDPGPWSWCMHVGMMHVSMMRQILWRTNQRTNGQGNSRSWIESWWKPHIAFGFYD